MPKKRDRHGSYFLGLKIRGKGDEDVPLFVTGLSDTTSSTGVDIADVMDTVTDTVTTESTANDKCDGSDGKNYSLLNVETQLELFEQYTTAVEKELEKEEKLENNPSQPSREQGLSTDSDRLQANDKTPDEPSPTVICGAVSFRTNTITNDEDDELKVGDKVRYIGKKKREYYGVEVMEVVQIKKHWTGNQITCNHSKGWTTWISENSLKKIN